MAMVVKNNMSAVSTLNTLNKNSNALQKSLSKVSSGMKINSAQDDASGYAISERMRVQIRSLDQANQNTQNGSSMMKTAEGAVSSTVEILKSLKEKAINAANDTNKDSDRVTIQKEIDQFIDQIDDNALTTFNGKYLVDGSKAQQGGDTYTAMTNQSLDKSTTDGTALTALKNRNGESLEIRSTDYVTASFVQNGNTYTTKFNVGTDNDLKAIFTKLNDEYTAQNSGNANSTTQIFGAAQTEVAAAASSYTDSATAVNVLTTKGSDTVLATIKGTTGSDTDVEAALAGLKGDDTVNAEDVVTAVVGSNSSTVEAALDSAISDALADAKVVFTNGHASNGATAGMYSATFKTAASTDLTGTATNSTTITAGGTEAVAIDLSANSDTVIAEAKSAAAGTTDIATAVANATVITPTAAMASGGNGPASAAMSTTAGETGSVAATDSAVKNYELATLLKGAVTPAAGGGTVEVHSGTEIGKNASGDMVYTADGEVGLTITANNKGVSGQISGVTISITDSDGNVKKSANASLDAFSTTIYAKNKSDRNELSFQVGAAANQAIAVGLEDMRSEALGLKGSDGSKVSVATQDKANAAVAVFDNAIQKALDQQTTIGAIEARLEYTSQNLTTSSENVQAAESTIRDADMAKEMTNYTKNNVLLQAAQSMLAQANQSSSAVLSLLQ